MANVIFDESFSSDEAIIQRWLLEEGDPVDEGEDLCEIAAGESTIMIQSPMAGVISEVYFDEGESVEKGEILCRIDEEEYDGIGSDESDD